MENYKECNVVMLATTQETNLFIASDKLFNYHKLQQGDNEISFNQHLYIIDDSEIKTDSFGNQDVVLGEYLYNIKENKIGKVTHIGGSFNFKGTIQFDGNKDLHIDRHCTFNCKKIIATTNTSLKIVSKDINPVYEKLPQIPTEFIQEYINRYNTNDVIKTVKVEFEEYSLNNFGMSNGEPDIAERLLINFDNTISIQAIKTSWNREEIKLLLLQFAKDCDKDEDLIRHYAGDYRDLNNWIQENL